MTSAILFVFGSISLMNMLMVDFQNRKREFGLLEAVGVTRKQLKAMLNREIGIYLGGSLAISLICGSIFSVIVCRRLDAINHCITLKLPWFFLLALICVLLVIYLVFSMYSKMELKKASILSAIKVSRLIGSCCIIELHKYFLKRENLPDDGKRKKAVVEADNLTRPFETAALISEPPFLCVYTIL